MWKTLCTFPHDTTLRRHTVMSNRVQRRSNGWNRDTRRWKCVSAKAQTAIRFPIVHRDRDSRVCIIPCEDLFVKYYNIIKFILILYFSTNFLQVFHRFSTELSNFAHGVHSFSTWFPTEFSTNCQPKNSCEKRTFWHFCPKQPVIFHHNWAIWHHLKLLSLFGCKFTIYLCFISWILTIFILLWSYKKCHKLPLLFICCYYLPFLPTHPDVGYPNPSARLGFSPWPGS